MTEYLPFVVMLVGVLVVVFVDGWRDRRNNRR